MKITKNSGDIVDFNKEKLRSSLLKSGAPVAAVEDMMGTIESLLYERISTRRIHKLARKLLRRISYSHAARYDLRPAIQMLGPAGFFFEKFMGRILEKQGYRFKNNVTLLGKCVSHEIDIALKMDSVITVAECKFHAQREGKSDVKVPMYVLSRFNDIRQVPQNIFSAGEIPNSCLIITNTRFTADAATFANCSGLKLLSWDYPDRNAIRELIDRGGLYPVTCLTTLTALEKEKLLIAEKILVDELLTDPDVLDNIGISLARRKNIIQEAEGLCNPTAL